MPMKAIRTARSHWVGGVIDSDYHEEPGLLLHIGDREQYARNLEDSLGAYFGATVPVANLSNGGSTRLGQLRIQTTWGRRSRSLYHGNSRSQLKWRLNEVTMSISYNNSRTSCHNADVESLAYQPSLSLFRRLKPAITLKNWVFISLLGMSWRYLVLIWDTCYKLEWVHPKGTRGGLYWTLFVCHPRPMWPQLPSSWALVTCLVLQSSRVSKSPACCSHSSEARSWLCHYYHYGWRILEDSTT